MPGRKKGASSRFSAAGAARKATTAAVFFWLKQAWDKNTEWRNVI